MVWRTWFCRNAKVAARQEVACVLPHARKFTARNCISVDVHRLIPRPTCACRLLKCKKKFNCTHAERLDTKLYSSWARPITYSQLLHVVNYPNYWCVQEHHDCGEFTTSLLWPGTVYRVHTFPRPYEKQVDGNVVYFHSHHEQFRVQIGLQILELSVIADLLFTSSLASVRAWSRGTAEWAIKPL